MELLGYWDEHLASSKLVGKTSVSDHIIAARNMAKAQGKSNEEIDKMYPLPKSVECPAPVWVILCFRLYVDIANKSRKYDGNGSPLPLVAQDILNYEQFEECKLPRMLRQVIIQMDHKYLGTL